GIACAAYRSTPPRNATDFLELAENCTFMDRKSINAINDAMKGYQCFLPGVHLGFGVTDKRFTLMSTGLFWANNVHLAGPAAPSKGCGFFLPTGVADGRCLR
ncbi:MAG: hypothetical protein WAJ95_03955, partial [Desulfobacterales bacterium]